MKLIRGRLTATWQQSGRVKGVWVHKIIQVYEGCPPLVTSEDQLLSGTYPNRSVLLLPSGNSDILDNKAVGKQSILVTIKHSDKNNISIQKSLDVFEIKVSK